MDFFFCLFLAKKVSIKVLALLLSTTMVLPIASVASANNSLIDESTTTVTAPIGENEPVIIDLGLTGNDDLFALNPLLAPVKWKDSSSFLNSSIITPMSTDGQNLNWDFYDVSSLVWSTALPNHRYGSITAKVVQTTLSSTYPATINYQFITKDYQKGSNVIQVVGNISSPATSITFSNVPQGTPSNPVYLLIRNVSANSMKVRGNGYTQ